MAIKISSIDTLLSKALTIFENTFNTKAEVATCAPGRVNLIGEHTDYNEGYVLPMALQMVTIVIGKKADNNLCKVLSSNFNNEIVQFETTPSKPTSPHWSSYIKGVVANFMLKTIGFNAVIISSVPIGGGVSSSASLEVAFYTFLECINNTKATSLLSKALSCQKAEHEYALVPCGIMDQYISTFGKQNCAFLIDCKRLQATELPIGDENIKFVLINSNVNHALANSEYSMRRRDCFKAAEIIGKRSLRDVSLNELTEAREKLGEGLWKRAKHVVSEIKRTLDACEAIIKQDFKLFGKLMTDSHVSLRDDYEVSCKELDLLVEIALSVPGVYGSRMTGGGFGGCTVTLIKEENINDLIHKVKNGYANPSIYICEASDGARILSI